MRLLRRCRCGGSNGGFGGSAPPTVVVLRVGKVVAGAASVVLCVVSPVVAVASVVCAAVKSVVGGVPSLTVGSTRRHCRRDSTAPITSTSAAAVAIVCILYLSKNVRISILRKQKGLSPFLSVFFLFHHGNAEIIELRLVHLCGQSVISSVMFCTFG